MRQTSHFLVALALATMCSAADPQIAANKQSQVGAHNMSEAPAQPSTISKETERFEATISPSVSKPTTLAPAPAFLALSPSSLLTQITDRVLANRPPGFMLSTPTAFAEESQIPDTGLGTFVQAGSEYVGFANNTSAQDRENELRMRCGAFRRVVVPGNGTDYSGHVVCAAVGKKCAYLCDWEGAHKDCNDQSQKNNLGQAIRDGSRVAFCVP